MWSAARTRFPELPVELALAAAMAVVTCTGVAFELTYSPYPVPPVAGAYLLGVASAAVLVARRRRPVLVAVAGLVIVAGYRLAGYPGEATGLALFVSFYTVGAYGQRVRNLVAGGVLVVLELLIPTTVPPHPQPWTSFAILGPGFGLAWMAVLGAGVGARRRAAEEDVRRAAQAAEARLREGMAQERLRIARELHDVLAHTISVIAVQSGLALDSLDSRPEQARAALLEVRAATRQAMPELRAALGLLRGDREPSGEPGALGGATGGARGEALGRALGGAGALAQPGLDQLAELADSVRSTGLRVDLSVTRPPEAAPLPPFLELTGYRIVQEALTNVVRHAHATTVTVDVRRADGALHIEVRDDGRGTAGPAGTGLGLAGMRERAALVGGTVAAGPGPDGGFRVSARLPVELT
jgi:signal transduction histidine kinase